jgi:hypothetical protein
VISLYLDEDMARHQLVGALRSRGFDVLTSLEAGMNGRSDDSQLAFAAAQSRVLLTANARDFAQLHRTWVDLGRTHSGIVLVPRQRYSTGEIIRRLLRVAASGTQAASGLLYLSNF